MAKQKTRFGREGFQAAFNRTMHFGTLTSSTVESVECSLCASGTSGTCQNAASKACALPTVAGRCPRRFSQCTAPAVVYRNVLSVSYEVEDWPFSSPDNTLRYSILLHAKKDRKVYPSDENYDKNFDLANIVDIPTLAVVRANNGDKRVIDINASLVEKRNKRMIFSVETPALALGETLFYN
jgi:hypothetical protein